MSIRKHPEPYLPQLQPGQAVEVMLPMLVGAEVTHAWQPATVVQVTAFGWVNVKTKTGLTYNPNRHPSAIRVPA